VLTRVAPKHTCWRGIFRNNICGRETRETGAELSNAFEGGMNKRSRIYGSDGEQLCFYRSSLFGGINV